MKPSNVNIVKFIKLFIIALVLTSGIQAQPMPARPGVPVIISPEIMPDNRVTFRLYAPEATKVAVSGEWMKNQATGENMIKNDSGLWTMTTEPLKEEFYGYTFMVNGIRAIDPNNAQVIRDGKRYSNYLIVPGNRSNLYKLNDVPHGTLSKVWYDSPALGMKRRLYIYTPAGYEGGKDKYPVLYLLHGSGGDEDAWTTMGCAVNILDNLIAQGRAKPMILVMTNGNANQSVAQNDLPMLNDNFRASYDSYAGKFENSIIKDIIPFIDNNYRAYTDREHRAISGLSMGGGHATYVGLNNIDKFAWIGSFSGAFVVWPNVRPAPGVNDLDMNAVRTKVFPNLSASANPQIKLLYLAIGTEDPLFQVQRKFKDWLKENKIQFVDLDIPGYAHVWPLWRINLIDFSSRLFK
jgi:enterochelin esterase-like enzyme